jgi:putative acetyltransferase
MLFKLLETHNKDAVKGLFTSVFFASEGEEEGQLIGHLAYALAMRIDNQDIVGFGADADGELIGAIFFTRLRFEEPVDVFMLSPVAVSTLHQRQGVGQALIRHGLAELKNRSASVVVTYGDPAFYSKLGFEALSQDVIRAPLDLSMPEGWLGQALRDDAMPVVRSRPTCIDEFNNPAYW